MTDICTQTAVGQNTPDYALSTNETSGPDKTILVITRNGTLSEPVMEYAVNVANRLECKLLVAYVNTLPMLDSIARGNKMKAAIESSMEDFSARAAEKPVPISFVQESGRVSQVIHRLCHIVKRVEFVVIDQQINVEKAASGASVPVFNVLSGNLPVSPKSGATRRGMHYATARLPTWKVRQLISKTLFYGIVTATMYGVLFFQSESVMKYWTMGGIYGILPIITACLFFAVQAAFFTNLTKLVRNRKGERSATSVRPAGQTAQFNRKQSRHYSSR